MRGGVRNLALVFALSSTLSCAHVTARARQSEATGKDERLPSILARVGQSVERYHAGLFGLAFKEVMNVEELREDMTAKKSREYVFESVVLREALSQAVDDYYAETVRRLKTVDGRAPKKGDDDAERDAATAYGEALNFLLPREQKLYEFTLRGEQTLVGRRAFLVALLRPGEGEPRVVWEGASFRVLAPTRWTFWVDAESFDVLRVESHLEAPFEFESPRLISAGPLGRFGPKQKFRYARQDYAVSFRRVELKDPDETRLVPDMAEWVTVIEGASHPGTRRTIRFSDYKRFRSDVKVVEEP
jgi:hypothetical protein